jgi:hypothetical protein
MQRLWYVIVSLFSMAVAVPTTGPLLAQTILPPVVVTAPWEGVPGAPLNWSGNRPWGAAWA